MSRYREEGSFVIRLELAADFSEDYEGDDDGYAWLETWRREARPALVRAAMEALRSHPRFEAIPVARGKNPEDEVEVKVSFRTEITPKAPAKA